MIAAAALAALLTAQAPAPPPPPPPPPPSVPVEEGLALIWGGGKTQAEADKAMAELKAKIDAGALSRLAFADGFPKVVKSDLYLGLKPGFIIVLVGLCPDEHAGPALALLKAENPGAYGRATPSASAAACAFVGDAWRAQRPTTAPLPSGESLRARLVDEPKGAGRFAVVELWDSSGETILDTMLFEEFPGVSCDGVAFTPVADGIDLAYSCLTPACTTPDEDEDTWSFTVKGKKIRAKRTAHKHTKGMCD